MTIAVVIYCFTKTSRALGFKFSQTDGINMSFLHTLARNRTKKIKDQKVFRLDFALLEKNYCESNVRVIMWSCL